MVETVEKLTSIHYGALRLLRIPMNVTTHSTPINSRSDSLSGIPSIMRDRRQHIKDAHRQSLFPQSLSLLCARLRYGLSYIFLYTVLTVG
jgi:hypothetical protein